MIQVLRTLMLYAIPVLISLSWLLGGNLVSKVSPIDLSSSRVAVGAAVLLLFSSIRRSHATFTNSEKLKWWGHQLLLSLTGRVLYFYLSARSLLSITPFEAVLISTMLPVFLLGLERSMGKRFKSLLIPVGALASVGAVITSLFVASPSGSFHFSTGHLEMALAMLAFAIHILLYKRFVRDTHPANPLFAQFLIAALIMLPMDTTGLMQLGGFSLADWVQFIIYAVVCNLAPFVLVHYCLKNFSSFTVGAVAILSPLFAFVIKGVSNQAPPRPTFMLISIFACILTYFTLRADQPTPKPLTVPNKKGGPA
jgi:drug/metabolite transporter (DMT)-like permease